jgi:hypothetical protein
MANFPNNKEQLKDFFTEMKKTQSEASIPSKYKPFYDHIKNNTIPQEQINDLNSLFNTEADLIKALNLFVEKKLKPHWETKKLEKIKKEIQAKSTPASATTAATTQTSSTTAAAGDEPLPPNPVLDAAVNAEYGATAEAKAAAAAEAAAAKEAAEEKEEAVNAEDGAEAAAAKEAAEEKEEADRKAKEEADRKAQEAKQKNKDLAMKNRQAIIDPIKDNPKLSKFFDINLDTIDKDIIDNYDGENNVLIPTEFLNLKKLQEILEDEKIGEIKELENETYHKLVGELIKTKIEGFNKIKVDDLDTSLKSLQTLLDELTQIKDLNDNIVLVEEKYNELKIESNPVLKQLFNQLKNFYDTLKSLNKTDKEIEAELNSGKLNDIGYFEFLKLEKFVKEKLVPDNEDLTNFVGSLMTVTLPKLQVTLPNLKDPTPFNNEIRSLTEKILGACRVILKYRDDDESFKVEGDKILKKHTGKEGVGSNPKYGYMIKNDDNETCTGVNFAETRDKDSKVKLFGPFSAIYDELQDTEQIFKNSFVEDDLISSVKGGKSLVMFGFGFSGSGKTYQLISPDNQKDKKEIHLLSLCLNHIAAEGNGFPKIQNITLTVSELYPYVNDDVTKEENISDNVYLTTQKELGYDPKLEMKPGEQIGAFITRFNDINKEITNIRTCLMRITPTPNNPESSRSHIFYEFNIKYEGETGKIVIVDMAGTENTIEIKRNFLDVKDDDQTYLNTRGMEIWPKYNLAKRLDSVKNAKEGIPGFVGWTGNEAQGTLALKEVFSTYYSEEVQLKNAYFSLTNSTKPKQTQGVAPTVREPYVKKQLDGNNGLSGEATHAYYFPHKAVIEMFLEITKIIFNINFDEPIDPAERGKKKLEPLYLANFRNADTKGVLITKIFHFYKKIENTSFELNQKNTAPTFLGLNIEDQNMDDLLTKMSESFRKYFVMSKTSDDIKNLLEWINVYGTGYSLEIESSGGGDKGLKDAFKELITAGKYISIEDEKTLKTLFGDTNQNVDKIITSSKKIDYKTPIQVYLVWFLDIFYKKKKEKFTIDTHKCINKTSLIIIICSFMYKYIKIVTDQGQGIVATLEHLKFFFLSKSAKNDDGIPKSLALYDEKNPDRQLADVLDYTEKDNNYVHEDKISTDVTMKERRQKGFVDKFKTIAILSKLAGWKGDMSTDKPYTGTNLVATEGSKFLMLAAVLRTKKNEQGNYDAEISQPKLCKATYDTLDLAENLASEPDPTEADRQQTYCLDEIAKDEAICKPTGGGSLNINNKPNRKQSTGTRKRRKYRFVLNSTKKRKPKKRRRKSK